MGTLKMQHRKRPEGVEPILIEETLVPQACVDYLMDHGVYQLRAAYQDRTGREYPEYDFAKGEDVKKYVAALEAEFEGENLQDVIKQYTDPRTVEDILTEIQRARASEKKKQTSR